ncbi:MAG: hypothetical protein SO051_02070, partial [Collinsella sp.]|nr:hypothetical protein [Collinsella sp.]
ALREFLPTVLYIGGLPQGLLVLGSVRPGAVGPGRGVFADNCFVGRAAFIAALSLVLGIFVLVELLLRMGWRLGFPLLFGAVSVLFEGRRS